MSKKLRVSKPMSLYPVAMLGSAMIPRSEIGFLISSLTRSNDVFGSPTAGGSSELYPIVTWAISLCTLIGPLAVGSLAKRVKRLQAIETKTSAGKTGPLGVWGMQGGQQTIGTMMEIRNDLILGSVSNIWSCCFQTKPNNGFQNEGIVHTA